MNDLVTVHKVIFDATNPNWTNKDDYNEAFIKGVQFHWNHMLQVRGHVFLNELFDALGFPRTREGARQGWVREESSKWIAIDAERLGADKAYLVCFDVDGIIWDRI